MAMTKTQIWSLAIGSAVLGAAATAAYFELSVKAAGHCDGAECQIAVKVIDCANGVLDVSPDPAHINEAKHIKWTIVSSGYVFTPTGIQISGSDFSPDPGLTGSGDKWRVKDAHQVLGATKYVIEVKPTAGAPCRPYDPFIFND
jgi:hypothetical protein